MENNNYEVVNETREDGSTVAKIIIPESEPVDKKKFILWVIIGIICFLLVCTVLSKVYEFGMNVLYSIVYGEDAETYGATERITFGKEEENYVGRFKVDSDNTFTVYYTDGDSYQYEASDWIIGKSLYVLDNYEVEHEGLTESNIYADLDVTHATYMETYDEFFNDFTSYKATQMLNNAMRNNLALPIKLEGEIISVEEDSNILRIYDMYDDYEGVHAYNNGVIPDILDCFVDISLIDNKENFYVNDYVTVYAKIMGKLPTQDGSYCPYIVAVALEFQ